MKEKKEKGATKHNAPFLYSGNLLDTLHAPPEEPLSGLDEAVRGPPRELVGRDKRIRVQLGSVRSARLREGEDGTRPNVPEGSAIEYVAQRPAALEALDEECPDRSDGNTSHANGVKFGVRPKEICVDVSVHIKY